MGVLAPHGPQHLSSDPEKRTGSNPQVVLDMTQKRTQIRRSESWPIFSKLSKNLVFQIVFVLVLEVLSARSLGTTSGSA